MTDITLIEAAARRLEGHVRRTPLLHAPLLDRLAGRRDFVKAECLQVTGSFKARGGWSAVSALSSEARARGVIAFDLLDLQRFGDRVADRQPGIERGLRVLEHDLHVAAQLLVQRRHRFVQQKQLRLVHDGPRQRHAPAHAARDLARQQIACAAQAWLGNDNVWVLYAIVAVWNGAFGVSSPARTSSALSATGP